MKMKAVCPCGLIFMVFFVSAGRIFAGAMYGSYTVENLSTTGTWSQVTCGALNLITKQYNCDGSYVSQYQDTYTSGGSPVGPGGTGGGTFSGIGNGYTCAGGYAQVWAYQGSQSPVLVGTQYGPDDSTYNCSFNIIVSADGCEWIAPGTTCTNTTTVENNDVVPHNYQYGMYPIQNGSGQVTGFINPGSNVTLQPGQSAQLQVVYICGNAGPDGILDTPMAAATGMPQTNSTGYVTLTNLDGPQVPGQQTTPSGGDPSSSLNPNNPQQPVYQVPFGQTPSNLVFSSAAGTNTAQAIQQMAGALYTEAAADALIQQGQMYQLLQTVTNLGSGLGSDIAGMNGDLSNLLAHIGNGLGTNENGMGTNGQNAVETNYALETTQEGATNIQGQILANFLTNGWLSSNQLVSIPANEGAFYQGGFVSLTNTTTSLALVQDSLSSWQGLVVGMTATEPTIPEEAAGDLFDVTLKAGGGNQFHLTMKNKGFDALWTTMYSLISWILVIFYAGACVSYIVKATGWLLGVKGFTIPSVEIAGFNTGAIAIPIVVVGVMVLWAAYLGMILSTLGGSIAWSSLWSTAASNPLSGMDSGAYAFLSTVCPIHLLIGLPTAYIVWRLTVWKLSLVILGALRITPS